MRMQNEVHEILESVEGTGQDEWPPSPPLQQIHEQTLPTGNVIWGLGMSGSSHWSGSFAVEADGPSATRRLHAELALRSSSPNAEPVSTYRVLDPQAIVLQTAGNVLEFRTAFNNLLMSVVPERAELQWLPRQRKLTIRPRDVSGSAKVTLSWDYYLGPCQDHV